MIIGIIKNGTMSPVNLLIKMQFKVHSITYKNILAKKLNLSLIKDLELTSNIQEMKKGTS